MAFTPKKKSTIKSQIINLFKEGKVLRADGYHNHIEVLSRNAIYSCKRMGNLSESGDLKVSRNTFYDIVHKLQKEYSVVECRCEHSGCCQYATYGYWLE